MALLLAALCMVQAATGGTVAGDGVYVTGDGKLTAAIDEQGRLVGLRWPSPGYFEHSTPPRSDGEAYHGATWYVESGTSWEPLFDAGWRARTDYTGADSLVLATHFEEIDGTRRADQRVFPWPDRDALVLEMRFHGFRPDTRIAWLQNFSPSTTMITGAADAGDDARGLVDFGAWYDAREATLLQFRPESAGRDAWRAVRGLDPNFTREALEPFGEGVYLSTRSPNPVISGAVGAEGGEWGGESVMWGRTRGMLVLEPQAVGEQQAVSVLIGAGATAEESLNATRDGRHAGVPALLRAGEAMGKDWLQGAWALPEGVSLTREILNLLLCIDRRSGAVLRAPFGETPQNYASVFDTVWAAAALDELGYTDAAARALAHHVDSVRQKNEGGLPAGSLPAHIYCDGRAARFDGAADPASAAWLIAACWRHARYLDGEGAAAYLASVWPVLSKCADHLALAPFGYGALAGPQPGDVDAAALEVHFLGLEYARRIAATLGAQPPAMWEDRWAELSSRIRARRLNAGPDEKAVDLWVSHWLAGLDAAERPGVGLDILPVDEAEFDFDTEFLGAAAAPSAFRDALRCLGALHGAPE